MDVRDLARMGGKARQAKMSDAERVKLAKKAGKAAGEVHKAKAIARKKAQKKAE